MPTSLLILCFLIPGGGLFALGWWTGRRHLGTSTSTPIAPRLRARATTSAGALALATAAYAGGTGQYHLVVEGSDGADPPGYVCRNIGPALDGRRVCEIDRSARDGGMVADHCQHGVDLACNPVLNGVGAPVLDDGVPRVLCRMQCVDPPAPAPPAP